MMLNGARIYCDGIEIDTRSQQQIEKIITSLKEVSPLAEVSLRFLKDGDIYEGLLWGRAIDSPIGVYSRGSSLNRLLDLLQKKVSMECLKIWKKKGQAIYRRLPTHRPLTLAEVG